MRWQKSSLCKWDKDQCVEVAGLDSHTILVRDSKTTAIAAFQTYTREEWQMFIDAVKRGEFDLRTDQAADAEEMMEQV